jgi:hypothetical protein
MEDFMNQNVSKVSQQLSAFDKFRLKETVPVRLKGIHERIGKMTFKSSDWRESRFRVKLYRFMAESIPLVNSVIWTWSRLAAAPGEFKFFKNDESDANPEATAVLNQLFERIVRANFGHIGNQDDLLHPLFQSFFLDGAVVGKMELFDDLSGISNFRFFDLARTETRISPSGDIVVIESDDEGERRFSGRDLFFHALNADLANPYGRSVLKAVPFISYVEQQLVDDMRRTMHNAGYHRLHVKIAPPERRDGEGDDAYVNRANAYFDGTVSMIKDIEPQDNPITWDDVAIEYIGPKESGGTRVSNWYLNHRAMIEEICSGTHLAPFLLGYSYNATTNWAQFKYDLVMRQVRSVQNAAISFLGWMAGIELALKGFDLTAKWRFDNNFSALALEQGEIKSKEAAYVIDLFNAGLIDRESATKKAARLL